MLMASCVFVMMLRSYGYRKTAICWSWLMFKVSEVFGADEIQYGHFTTGMLVLFVLDLPYQRSFNNTVCNVFDRLIWNEGKKCLKATILIKPRCRTQTQRHDSQAISKENRKTFTVYIYMYFITNPEWLTYISFETAEQLRIKGLPCSMAQQWQIGSNVILTPTNTNVCK